jgi:hypothetical protein
MDLGRVILQSVKKCLYIYCEEAGKPEREFLVLEEKWSENKKIVSLGIEPRTFPEHLLWAIVNGKS